MQAACLCCGASHPRSAMIRISAGLRNFQARAAVRCLLVTQFPSSSSSASSASSTADYTSSAIAFRGSSQRSTLVDLRRQPPVTAPPTRSPLPDVTAGGGPRPKKPKAWRTKTKRGSIAKASKLVDVVNKLSNSKEEVYGALDAWIAWDLEFPLVAVKKALKTLRDEQEWRRIIQVCKWMLDKGQGKTLGTYQLLLQAFDHEGRIEEAEALWQRVFRENMECIPRSMFAQVIGMYDRHAKYKDLLKVFADMDELQVKPDPSTVTRVAKAYSHYGYEEHAQSLLATYQASRVDHASVNGKQSKFKNRVGIWRPGMVESEQEPSLETQSVSRQVLETAGSRERKEVPTLDMSAQPREVDRRQLNDRPIVMQELEELDKLQESPVDDSNDPAQRPNGGTIQVLEDKSVIVSNGTTEKSITVEAGNDGGRRLALESCAEGEGLAAVARDAMKGLSTLKTAYKFEEGPVFEADHGREENVTSGMTSELNRGPRSGINDIGRNRVEERLTSNEGFRYEDQSRVLGEIALKDRPTLKESRGPKSSYTFDEKDAERVKF